MALLYLLVLEKPKTLDRMLNSPGGSKAMSGSETEPPLLYIRLGAKRLNHFLGEEQI